MFGLTGAELIVVVVGLLSIIKFVMDIVKNVSNPNIEQDKKIIQLEDGCSYKHKAIDEKFQAIGATLTLIQENHLRHIEADVAQLKSDTRDIFTILNERLPQK